MHNAFLTYREARFIIGIRISRFPKIWQAGERCNKRGGDYKRSCDLWERRIKANIGGFINRGLPIPHGTWSVANPNQPHFSYVAKSNHALFEDHNKLIIIF